MRDTLYKRPGANASKQYDVENFNLKQGWIWSHLTKTAAGGKEKWVITYSDPIMAAAAVKCSG